MTGNHCLLMAESGQRGKGARLLEAGELSTQRVVFVGRLCWSERRKLRQKGSSASAFLALPFFCCEQGMMDSRGGDVGLEPVKLGSSGRDFGG